MEIDYQAVLWQSFGIAAGLFWQMILDNPWLGVMLGAMLLAGSILRPAPRRRRTLTKPG
ncbi:hypothetical protein [Cryobacterium fucosi]|uniref:hypothetical protein n=1 Tax=Cryobacterium fucosi TaxID=1259157 RepID=UPI00141B87EA|nr:hypothetical protein [Cryobacterium fucosi]